MVNFSDEWETMLATEIHFKVVGSCAPCSEYCLPVCVINPVSVSTQSHGKVAARYSVAYRVPKLEAAFAAQIQEMTLGFWLLCFLEASMVRHL